MRQEVVDEPLADRPSPSQQPDGYLSDEERKHLVKLDEVRLQDAHPAVAAGGWRLAVHGEKGRLEHDRVAELVHVGGLPAALLVQVVLTKYQHQVTHHALCQGREVIPLEENEAACDLLLQAGELASNRWIAKGK